MKTLVEVLRRNAEKAGDKWAYTSLGDSGDPSDEATVTWETAVVMWERPVPRRRVPRSRHRRGAPHDNARGLAARARSPPSQRESPRPLQRRRAQDSPPLGPPAQAKGDQGRERSDAR